MRHTDMISYQARLDPERPAIIAGDRVVSYGMLEQAVRSVVVRLAAYSLPAGSIVGLSIAAPGRHAAVSLALARCGLVSAPFVSHAGMTRLPEMVLVLTDQAFILDDGTISVAVGDDWFTPTGAPSGTSAVTPAQADTPCRVYLSSGTTGEPKRIVETFGSLDDQLQTGLFLQCVAGEVSRLICLMGLASAWGYRFALSGLAYGMTLYFANGAEETLRTILIHRCQYLVCSVQQLQGVVERQRAAPFSLPSLRAVCTGGSMVSLELVQATQALLVQRVMVAYGSTELGLTSLEVANVNDWQPGVTGYVTPWTQAQALDDDGNVLPRGEEGALRLRAKGQAQFGGEPADDGGLPWFYPGDRGVISLDDRITITGRTVELINVGGAKMSAERIEHALLRHPSLKDAGVIGVVESNGMTSIRAAVVSDGPIDEHALRGFIAATLPAAAPKTIVRVAAIPRGDNTKILRAELRKLLS